MGKAFAYHGEQDQCEDETVEQSSSSESYEIRPRDEDVSRFVICIGVKISLTFLLNGVKV